MPPTSAIERVTKQERAQLVFTLSNPMHQDASCASGIRGLVSKVLAKGPEDDPRQGSVLRAAMVFLSTSRSDEQHVALREHLVTCNCNPKTRAFHRPSHRPLQEVLEVCLFHICSSMSTSLLRLGSGKFRRRKENVSADAQPWPLSISDVVPDVGEHELLINLLQWAAVLPGGDSVFFLIGALARWWDPFARLIFQTPGIYRLAMNHIQHALDSYDPNSTHVVKMNTFVSPVVSCAQGLFYTVSEIDSRGTLDILADIFEPMHAIAVRITPILLSLRAQNSLANAMEDCLRWFGMVMHMRVAFLPDGTVRERPNSSMNTESHYIGAWDRMLEIRNRNQCLHIGCTSETGERSSVCSRCGIVRYCSRECLEAAWAAPRLPHKSLCKKIRELRAATLLLDDKAWNRVVRDDPARHRSPLDFVATCHALALDVRIAEAIWRGIKLLTQEKLKFQMEAQHGKEPDESSSEGELSEQDVSVDSDGSVEDGVDETEEPLPDEEVD
ncbi:hypothetical protein C8R43DRAFT_453003 [Mycena crocata]|nr:hypothetical protein C8R43DRAFT_453003 [Mycena crocata]